MIRSRRNPLSGRASTFSWVIGGVSGALAATAGVSPTGTRPVDVVLVAVFAMAVTAAAATAPWWAITAACGIAAASTGRPELIALASCGAATAMYIGARRRNLPLVRSVAVLLGVQVFARLGSHLFFGFTSIVACSTLGALLICGLLRRKRVQRRRAWVVIGVVGGAITAAGVGLVIAGLTARAPLEEANRQTHAGLDALNAGDMSGAAAHFGAAATSFRSADDDLTAAWAQPARLLPVAAQHRAGAVRLSAAAADALTKAAEALSHIDPNSVRISNGKIDLAAVRALSAPFGQVSEAIATLTSALDDTRSPWLVGPLRDKLTELRVDLQHNEVEAANASLAVQLAPDMLGGDGLRRYFIAFTTPAEARGLGGFMGNWAEMTIDQGHISITRFGRNAELNAGGADPTARTLTGMDDFLERWGRFGFADSQGRADKNVWSILTMAPDFPTVGQVIAQLYPQSGGQPIDGAFALDPDAVAALMSITGPITVEGIDHPLDAQNATQFILSEQYRIPDKADRVDLLGEIAQATVQRLLSSTMPAPADLAETFGPLARAGRLVAWSAHDDEQALLRQVGMDGAFPQLDGRDGVAVVIDNEGANKIDQFLDVSVDYRAAHSGGTAYTAELRVTLTNNSPSAGLPAYVIGNPLELPDGTNRMFLQIYTAMPMVSASLDGTPTTLETGRAFGWNVAAQLFDIPPGASRVFTLQLAGPLAATPYSFVTRTQPLARPVTTVATPP